MRHRNAVTSQFLCSRVRCGNAKQLRRSMTRYLRNFTYAANFMKLLQKKKKDKKKHTQC